MDKVCKADLFWCCQTTYYLSYIVVFYISNSFRYFVRPCTYSVETNMLYRCFCTLRWLVWFGGCSMLWVGMFIFSYQVSEFIGTAAVHSILDNDWFSVKRDGEIFLCWIRIEPNRGFNRLCLSFVLIACVRPPSARLISQFVSQICFSLIYIVVEFEEGYLYILISGLTTGLTMEREFGWKLSITHSDNF